MGQMLKSVKSSQERTPTNSNHPEIKHNYQKIPNLQFNKDKGKKLKGLVGLTNLGNTCFMNASIQCLINVQPLTDYFLSGCFLHEINQNNSSGTQGDIAKIYGQLCKAIWSDEQNYIDPVLLFTCLKLYAPQFADGEQHDSHEFLTFCLDRIHEDLNRNKAQKIVDDELDENGNEEDLAALSWEAHLKRHRSVVVDLFQGQLKSTVTCLSCNYHSIKFDSFMFLSLPIPQNVKSSKINIFDCIREFQKQEYIDGWICPKCKIKVEAQKQIDIYKIPPVLLVHFKRFQFFYDHWGKINKHIDFPLQGLDLNDFICSPQKENPIYDLFAVSIHDGTMTQGHYTAVIKNRFVQRWYFYDDFEVNVIAKKYEQYIINQGAYVLFFAKTSLENFNRQSLSLPQLWPHVSLPAQLSQKCQSEELIKKSLNQQTPLKLKLSENSLDKKRSSSSNPADRKSSKSLSLRNKIQAFSREKKSKRKGSFHETEENIIQIPKASKVPSVQVKSSKPPCPYIRQLRIKKETSRTLSNSSKKNSNQQ